MNTKGLVPAYSYTDEDQKNLNQILEIFGSSISLKEITSAYSKAGRDLRSATDMLCSMNQKGSHDASALDPKKCVKVTAKDTSSGSSGHHLRSGHVAKTKLKKSSASLGAVSNVIGKEYITPKPQSVAPCEKHKSVLLTSDDIPASELWEEEKELEGETTIESMDRDLGEFIYQMLGSGFGLDKDMIHDVIGQCGYNVQMGIDKLLEFSAVTEEKSNDVAGASSGNNQETGFDMKSLTQPTANGISESPSGSFVDVVNGEEVIPTNKKVLPNELLASLFTLAERSEEKPRLKGPESVDKNSAHIVTGPPKGSLIEDFTFITRRPIRTNGEANERSYEDLRASVKENWLLMKGYYKAAVGSFIEKDYKKAQHLMEMGQMHKTRAKEAEEKSAEKLIQDRDESEELSLNVYHLEPREAKHTFRVNLKLFSGLPSIQYVKAVTGTEGGSKKTDRRRKKKIIELLENEGIPWTEEGNGLIISVRADVIDPGKLSFADK